MKKKKVLIVDDDISLTGELKCALEACDYEVEILNDAASAVKIADEIGPDIIFLDIKMPGKSGFQVADDLKHFSGTANIPVIAMTGHFTEQQHKKFMYSIGFNDCIIKPFSQQDLVLKIERYAKVSETGIDKPASKKH